MAASQQLDSNQRRAGHTATTTVTAKMLPAAPLLSCPAPTGGDCRDLKDWGGIKKKRLAIIENWMLGKHPLNQLRANGH